MQPFNSACIPMHQLYCSAAKPGCAQNVECGNTCYRLWAVFKSKHLMPFKDHHWGSQSPRRSSGSLFGLVLTFWMRLSILGPILSKLSLKLKHLTFGHSTFLCTILQPENWWSLGIDAPGEINIATTHKALQEPTATALMGPKDPDKSCLEPCLGAA